MVLDRRLLAWFAAIALGALAVGCGDSDDGGELTMSEAKSRLVDDCQDDDDTAQEKRACTCVADELERQKLTPKRIDALRKIANDTAAEDVDEIPQEFDKAISACAARLARERR